MEKESLVGRHNRPNTNTATSRLQAPAPTRHNQQPPAAHNPTTRTPHRAASSTITAQPRSPSSARRFEQIRTATSTLPKPQARSTLSVSCRSTAHFRTRKAPSPSSIKRHYSTHKINRIRTRRSHHRRRVVAKAKARANSLSDVRRKGTGAPGGSPMAWARA